jgi:hypothetical protein
MSDTTTIEVVHLVEVDSDSPDDDCYFATCSCGWTGDIHREAEWATVDAAEHRDQAVGPPDGLDRTMSDLLDLQDDLAETVVWLAEHWSADLPTPFVNGTNHYGDDDNQGRAGVILLVWCDDHDVLARAAARLEVPVITDPDPDSSGNRYQRATRRFGRIHLQAYSAAGDVAS